MCPRLVFIVFVVCICICILEHQDVAFSTYILAEDHMRRITLFSGFLHCYYHCHCYCSSDIMLLTLLWAQHSYNFSTITSILISGLISLYFLITVQCMLQPVAKIKEPQQMQFVFSYVFCICSMYLYFVFCPRHFFTQSDEVCKTWCNDDPRLYEAARDGV